MTKSPGLLAGQCGLPGFAGGIESISVNDAQRILSKARAAIRTGSGRDADAVRKPLSQVRPRSAEVEELAGRLELMVGHPKTAVSCFEAALRFEPENPQRWMDVAEALDGADNVERAWQVLEQAASRFPGSLTVFCAMGRLAFQFGRSALAAEKFEIAAGLGLLDSASSVLHARCLLDLKRFEDATRVLEEAIEQRPDAEALTLLGYVSQSEGKFEVARELFLRAIEADGGPVAAFHGLVQGKRILETDRPIVEKMEERLRTPRLGDADRMSVCYALAKAREDLEEFEDSFEKYRHANELAFKVNLNSKPFDWAAHEALLERTRQVFDPAVLRSARGGEEGFPVPVFVVGMMRSGTSLLEQILSAHSQVEGAGEIEFWLDQQERSLKVSEASALRSEYQALIRDHFPGAARVVDKMPANYQMVGAIHLAFPSAPIIHIVRDPMDTCVSIYTTAYSVSPAFAHELRSIRRAYEAYRGLMGYWRESLPPGRMIEVSYEELVRDREGVLRSVFRAMDLPWEEAVLRHEENRTRVVTPSVWQVRQRVHGGSVQRWRRFESHLEPLKPLLEG